MLGFCEPASCLAAPVSLRVQLALSRLWELTSVSDCLQDKKATAHPCGKGIRLSPTCLPFCFVPLLVYPHNLGSATFWSPRRYIRKCIDKKSTWKPRESGTKGVPFNVTFYRKLWTSLITLARQQQMPAYRHPSHLSLTLGQPHNKPACQPQEQCKRPLPRPLCKRGLLHPWLLPCLPPRSASAAKQVPVLSRFAWPPEKHLAKKGLPADHLAPWQHWQHFNLTL